MYLYANANPVDRIDPNGRYAHIIVGALLGGVGYIGYQVFRGESITLGGLVGGLVVGGVTAALTPTLGLGGATFTGSAAGGLTDAAIDRLWNSMNRQRRENGQEAARQQELERATEGADWNNQECNEAARDSERERQDWERYENMGPIDRIFSL